MLTPYFLWGRLKRSLPAAGQTNVKGLARMNILLTFEK